MSDIQDSLREINDKLSELTLEMAICNSKLEAMTRMDDRINKLEQLRERGVGFKAAGTTAAAVLTFVVLVYGVVYQYAKSIPSPTQDAKIARLEARLNM